MGEYVWTDADTQQLEFWKREGQLLLGEIRTVFQPGDRIPSRSGSAELIFGGILKYDGRYDELHGIEVVVLESTASPALKKITIFPYTAAWLLKRYTQGMALEGDGADYPEFIKPPSWSAFNYYYYWFLDEYVKRKR